MINPWRFRLSLVILMAAAMTLPGLEPDDGTTPAGQKVSEKINKVADTVLRFNIRSKTLGGKQFWTDYLVQHEWRIQRNEVTNHYRLLSGRDYRHSWGTFLQCRKTLEEINKQKKLPQVKGKVVLLLHGLGRTRGSMEGLQKYLDKQEGPSAGLETLAPTPRHGRTGDHLGRSPSAVASDSGSLGTSTVVRAE